jgi:metallophosphoesterase superfamily enzyme
MQVCFKDLIFDSRRAVFAAEQRTLIISDLFLGMGAARRRRESLPVLQHQDVPERLLGLVQDYEPKTVALLGDIKPDQGRLENDEADELRDLFRKLAGRGRSVVQVVSHPERLQGPTMESIGVTPAETYRLDPHTLMHRRRTFVYPRHDGAKGLWLNGGVHPLFAVPTPGPAQEEGWLRYPAFLYTGFAVVMPPFVPYAQGWEVMQVDRIPKMARAWTLLGDHMKEMDIHSLPPPPDSQRLAVRPRGKGKPRPEHPGGQGAGE